MNLKRLAAASAVTLALCGVVAPTLAATSAEAATVPGPTVATSTQSNVSSSVHVTSVRNSMAQGYFLIDNETGHDLTLTSDVQANQMTLGTAIGTAVPTGTTTRIDFRAQVDQDEQQNYSVDPGDYLIINLSSPDAGVGHYEFELHDLNGDGSLYLFGLMGRAMKIQFPFDSYAGQFTDPAPVAVLAGA